MENIPYGRLLEPVRYGGFWIRVAAIFLDSIIISILTVPILIKIYGIEYIDSDVPVYGVADFVISWLLPGVALVIFWKTKQTTPGKYLFSLKIVDERTLEPASVKALIVRYFGYFIAMLPLGLGVFWVAFDKKKQGWHDKIAGTVVIKFK